KARKKELRALQNQSKASVSRISEERRRLHRRSWPELPRDRSRTERRVLLVLDCDSCRGSLNEISLDPSRLVFTASEPWRTAVRIRHYPAGTRQRPRDHGLTPLKRGH